MNLGTETVRSTLPCNLCGGRDAVIASRLDRDGKPLQTVICRSCGLVWTDPSPNSAAVRHQERSARTRLAAGQK